MSNPNAIACVSVYQLRLPLTGFGSRWVGRERPEFHDSTIVTLDTEVGLVGVGESCPLGAIYLPAFAAGLRAALAELAPALLGEDATQINRIHRVMNAALFGHGYAKAAIDIACWDLLGQHCAQPVSRLLGGRFATRIPLYLQCTGGSGITQAALVHLAHASAPERLLNIWDSGDLVALETVANPVPRKDGRMHAHHLPGLGAEPLTDVLGEPVAVYS